MPSLEEENRRLRRENARLLEEREILKKAPLFFFVFAWPGDRRSKPAQDRHPYCRCYDPLDNRDRQS